MCATLAQDEHLLRPYVFVLARFGATLWLDSDVADRDRARRLLRGPSSFLLPGLPLPLPLPLPFPFLLALPLPFSLAFASSLLASLLAAVVSLAFASPLALVLASLLASSLPVVALYVRSKKELVRIGCIIVYIFREFKKKKKKKKVV